MSEFWRITSTLLVVLALTSALAGYVMRRASWAFGLPRAGRHALGTLLGVGLLSALAARLLGFEYAGVASALGAFGGAVMLAVVISSVLLLPLELARLVAYLLRKLPALRRGATTPGEREGADPREAPPTEPASASASALESTPRRAFLVRAAAGSALTLGTGAASYATMFGRRDYTLETVPIKLAKLPRELDGLTIVQLSDLHVGTYVGARELAAALRLVRDARPDLVVLTGDLLDHDPSYVPVLARFARSLGALAPQGVFAIPGNHDHYAGAAAVLRGLSQAGAEVLLNRHVRIGQRGAQLALGGLDDVAGQRFNSPGPDPERAFQGVPDELARVMLSHNPAYFPHSREFADLTLSGHTHGGQITMFINPARWVLHHGLVRGHYAIDGSQLYVNRGFGTAGPPARIGSPPEVTKIVLHT